MLSLVNIRTSNPDAFTYTYVYDGDGNLKQIKRGSTVEEAFVHDVNRALPVILFDSERKYVWGLSALYSVDLDFDEECVLHYDGLGSVVGGTENDSGYPSVKPAFCASAAYLAFGEENGTGGTSGGLEFTGEYEEERTGYTYLRARYYDPQIARFMSRDTVAGDTRNPASLNRYSYVHNNPVNLVDPTGHWAGILIGVALLVSGVSIDLAMNPQELSDDGVGGQSEEEYLKETLPKVAVTNALGWGVGKALKPVATSLYHSPQIGRPPVFGTSAYFFGLRQQLQAVEAGVDFLGGLIVNGIEWLIPQGPSRTQDK